ncbi:DNA/RNA non-specific endonuclease [Cytophagaceae bacterium DM2B3-1]|uniref:DNA/RNA non-specific endonuclease n=1 Tax=Xanthocytophaga flava TaxID=3048013 RepID=A0ABT7CTY2_9BACT|nr:DNA/RNA non-specific endonuclease [Xanthocytophaga flavus]MDJ1497235.1 DNA/RNA non-specific endonuclease [Xanthocytophaga flavus]
MRKAFYHYRLFIFLLFQCVIPVVAQTTYPVQVNTHLLPPHSLYLSDYYSGTREKLTVTLVNRDQLKPTLTVRLRMTITAAGGLRIQTNEQAFIQPLIVESGSPVRLTLDDLAPYFQPQNLTTQGYLTDGKLPEGMVEFCFQAIEAYTNQPLSVSTCARAFITSQKPPLLSLPQNNESIAFRDPLNMMFQWTPRHQGLTYVEYEFILKELWDNGMPPQAAFPYSPEIHRETVRGTSLLYNALLPPLLPGKRYAWCVRAQAREGIDAVNLFQNDGYSEVRTFLLQDNCAPPAVITATAERKRLNLEWNTAPEYIGFTVSYRIKRENNPSEWKEQTSVEPRITLYGLENGGTYEYRVASSCMAGQPVYGPVMTIALPQADSSRLAQCGIMPAVNLSNQQPIKELKTGEVIMANDFPVTLTRVSGGGGVFSGEGWTIIPWLNDAKIAVTFTSITVNTDRQMINGYIEARYDKNEGQIANIDDVFEGGFDVGTVKTGLSQIDYTFDFSIPGVEAFSLNDEGELVVTDASGEPHTVTSADKEGQGNEGNKVVVFPMTVKDKDGNMYQVEKVTETDANGNEATVAKATYVGKVGATLADGSFDPTQLNGDKAIVTFNKGKGYYAFDTWLEYYDKVALIREKYQKLYTNYYVPWKLVPVTKSDVVSATIEIKDKTIDPTKVIFKTPTGTEFKSEYDPSTKTYTIQVVGGPSGDAQELYALYATANNKYWTLGKLSIVSYNLQTHKVVLVPVNGTRIDEQGIKQALDSTYGPVGVTWQVEVDKDYLYTGVERLMSGSTGLSTYNDDMKALNNQYKQDRADEFDPAASYLFFLKATGAEKINQREAVGFMPRGAQFGYLFTSEIENKVEPQTVAHELGHGRWKLYHTFDKHYGGYEQEQTQNVMDYANGMHLAKWQWDIMNDPAMVVSAFEKDEKSAIATAEKGIPLPEDYTFLSASGYAITLPKGATILHLCDDGNYLEHTQFLKRFRVGTRIYALKAAWNSGGMYGFKGYVDEANPRVYYGQSQEQAKIQKNNVQEVYVITQSRPDKGLIELTLQKGKLAQPLPTLAYHADKDGKYEKQVEVKELKLTGKLYVTPSCGQSKDNSQNVAGSQAKSQPKPQSEVSELDQFMKGLTESLGKKLQKYPNTAYTFTDCNGKNKHTVTADRTQNTQGKNVITIQLCNGKLTLKDFGYGKKLQGNPKLGDVSQQQLEEEVRKRLEKELQQAQNQNKGTGTPAGSPKGEKFEKTVETGEQMKIDKSDLWGFLPEVVELGENLYEEAALPKKYWHETEAGFKESPIRVPAMAAGVTDGVIDEVTEKLQFIQFGLDIATDKDVISNTWNKVKQIRWEDVKAMAESLPGQLTGYDNYKQGGSVAWHQGGQHVVVVASSLWGGGLLVFNFKQADDLTGDQLGKKFREGGKLPDSKPKPGSDPNHTPGGSNPTGSGQGTNTTTQNPPANTPATTPNPTPNPNPNPTPVLPIVGLQPRNSNCQLCTTRSEDICQLYEQVRDKAVQAQMLPAKAEEAVNKLCATITLSDEVLREMAGLLLSYSNPEVKVFLQDVNGYFADDSEALSKNVSRLNADIVRAWKKLYGSDFRKNYEYLRTIKEVPQYTITVNGTTNVSVTDAGGKLWATLLDNKRIEAVGGTGITTASGQRNQILNIIELLHGATYLVSNYVIYTIDQYGRVSMIEANLQRLPPPKSNYPRDERLQGLGNSSSHRDGKTGDNGGHMVGARFNGPVELINYHAQDGPTNRNGAWKRMEDEWDQVLTGRPNNNPPVGAQSVQVQIRPQFNGTSKRPFRFDVRFQYGNNQPENRQIPNP